MTDSKLSTAEQIESIWKLGGLTPGKLAKKVAQEIMDDDLLGRASELAYNFLLAVFPLMLFLLALFGLFASRGMLLRTRLLIYFADLRRRWHMTFSAKPSMSCQRIVEAAS